MQSFEYRVVPAPRRGVKAKGARLPEDRFALAVEGEMNRMARDGWEFVRSDTLPAEERRGLFARQETVSRTVLVFRRAVAAPVAMPMAMPAASAAPVAMPLAAPAAVPVAAAPAAASPAPSRPAYLASTPTPAVSPPTGAAPPVDTDDAAELTRQMWHGTTFRRSPAPPAPIPDPRLVSK